MSAPVLRALIWDVDGTLAETERDGHRVAFNQAFSQHGLPWRWDEVTYGRLLQVAGGPERLLHDMRSRADAPSTLRQRERLARVLHASKTEAYAALVAQGRVALRPGVRRLLDDCERTGIALAIATTTSRSNVHALCSEHLGRDWSDRFRAVVCADDAPRKKPHPMAYLVALQRLGASPSSAMAVEDSPNGLSAATAAGLPTLVTRSAYFADEPFAGCAALCDDLNSPVRWRGGEVDRVDLGVLRRAHAGWFASQVATLR